ncbi:DUF2189 domain-containing protein [Denitromonas iodatirespirans]|uniref:DUF2189 domain-containing protein n=1 Tax=Denitromonas iodatirespirans TaxID=2795389 RepID=A0A944H9H8_DENI1|nr:DUF2189 domain-containing protein [Denitromonas iodatirespirans]MBT0962470.1 DUF2189 domain-containing protein [Denitromonas iodatirespirans]
MSVHGIPEKISLALIGRSLHRGWRDFLGMAAVSMGFAAGFVVIGLGLMVGTVTVGMGPMVPALIGGFMLFGPVSMAGYHALLSARRAGHPVRLRLAYGAMRHAGRPVWVMGVFCSFIVLIWLTDAGTLYSFMVGQWRHDWLSVLPHTSQLLRFHAGAAIMGGGLALIVYTVTVHSVPLLIRGQGTLVTAVTASVRAVGRSFFVHLGWAVTLALTVMASIFLLPALLVVLPVVAYASIYWNEAVFPDAENGTR